LTPEIDAGWGESGMCNRRLTARGRRAAITSGKRSFPKLIEFCSSTFQLESQNYRLSCQFLATVLDRSSGRPSGAGNVLARFRNRRVGDFEGVRLI
jgi:hypothetical protein